MSDPVLRIQLLGSFSFAYNNVAVAGLNSPRLQSLLAYLILNANNPPMRQHLAFTLWPDTTDSQARNNLRQLLYQLRQALPESDRFLITDTNTVWWKTSEEQEIDVYHFRRSLSSAVAAEQQGAMYECRQHLQQAAAYYLGDLLPGCYDDWIAPERDHLRLQYGNTCRKLVHLLESQREFADALQAAQSLHRLDPLDEGAYESLVRLHGLNGDRAGAKRVYQIATETLKRELDTEPGEALQVAYKRILRAPRTTPLSEGDISSTAYKLVGRQVEWQQLQTTWQHVVGGEAHLCLITGEAGIGKSRLAEELFNWVARQGFTAAYTRSYSVEGRLSLAPITEWLRSGALRPHLASLDPIWLTELARLLPELLSEHTDLARPEPITEYGRRQRFFEALARGVLAAPQPLLLWIDDLQWCDQETLEWLHFLLRFEPHSPIFILGTARSEESPPYHPVSALARQLRADNRVTTIELSQLDAAETARLASQVQGHTLDDVASVCLYRETEGNPLFVVEAIRAGMSLAKPAQTGSLITPPIRDTRGLPPRVQAIIAGRLAQLTSTARTVAEIGAAIGRSFSLDLLLTAGRENEETVIDALNELWLRRIVREQSANVFDFTHDKLREVTYSETSQPQRRLLHRRIAQALESLNVEDIDLISAQLASHYEHAGLFDLALPYFQRAGSVAADVYANDDAINLYVRALEMLGKLPAGVKRDVQELDIQFALATLYRISKGWTSPEEERVTDRIMELSDKVGSVEQRIRALYGLQSLYIVQAQCEKVERANAQVHELFTQAHCSPPPFADIYLAGAKLHMGQIVESRERFESIIAVRDNKHIRDLQESQGLNYLVHGLSWNAHGLWCLGYPQSALSSAHAAVEFARDFAQPFNQALAITYLALLQTWQTDTDALVACAEEACALTIEYKAPYYHAWARIMLHYAQVDQQPDADNLNRLSDAIHVFTRTGARIRLPIYYSLLAQACLKVGLAAEGLEALELATAESIQNNEHWWDAEIHRLRGELMWTQGAELIDIEAAFLRAVDIARSQQARSLELRAASSLARLWRANSRAAEAKKYLTTVYDWFTEGFDTPDLRTAHTLINSL